MNRQYLDPALLRRAIRPRCARSSATPGRSGRPKRHRADPRADRLPRRQLLHAQRRPPRRDRCPLKAVRGEAAAVGTYTETGWEVFPQGLTDTLLWVEGALRRHPAVHHRERRRLLRSAAAPSGRVAGSAARRLLCAHLRAVHAAIDAGRRRPRLLRLVAARQPRVVARLLQALRHRPRGLRDARAHAEGQREVLRRRHRVERRCLVRGGLTSPCRHLQTPPARRRAASVAAPC